MSKLKLDYGRVLGPGPSISHAILGPGPNLPRRVVGPGTMSETVLENYFTYGRLVPVDEAIVHMFRLGYTPIQHRFADWMDGLRKRI